MASYNTIQNGSPMFKALQDYLSANMNCSIEEFKQDSGCGNGQYNAVVNKDSGYVEFESIKDSSVHVEPHTTIRVADFW